VSSGVFKRPLQFAELKEKKQELEDFNPLDIVDGAACNGPFV
jgi:hypothetical protein